MPTARLVRWQARDLDIRDDESHARRHDVDVVAPERHLARDFDDGHACAPLQNADELARTVRLQMCDDHECDAQIDRNAVEKRLERTDAACRASNSHRRAALPGRLALSSRGPASRQARSGILRLLHACIPGQRAVRSSPKALRHRRIDTLVWETATSA
jgi:hypothetical protein